MRKSTLLSLLILAFNFAIAIYFYPKLPDQIASHWNTQGMVNGYTSKFWGVYFVPVLVLVLFTIFLFIPKIDPKKENIAKFRSYFDGLVLVFMLFFTYIFSLTIAWNLGKRFDFVTVILPALAILFFYIGILLGKAKQNWFVGIRTPWTLSSEKVWDKTHHLGSFLFKAAALISLVGIFFKTYAVWFLLGPIIFATLVSIVYSFLEFQKLKPSK